MQDMYLRKLQTIPRNHGALITIAAPFVKKLQLNPHDIIIEELRDNTIILTKANINRANEDGVVG
jgi:hypothetical protein